MLTPVVDPVIFRLDADEDTRGLAMPSYHAFFLLGQLEDLRPLPAVETEDATYRAITLIPFLLVRSG